MIPRTYDPSQVLFSLSGYRVTGFAEGTFISLNQNTDYFTHVPGIRGKPTRKRTRDRSGSIRIRLLQTHPDNEVFSQIVRNDDFNQTALLTVFIKDLLGQSEMQYDNAYLAGYPNVTYTSDGTTANEWVINYQYEILNYTGGNNTPSIDFDNPFNFS